MANLVQQIIEASKAWRDAWVSILGINVSTSTLFEELYNPIVGAGDGHGRDPVMTSRPQLDRTSKLKDVYTDLKTDLLEEVNMMESRVIKPATEAKDYIQPIRKVIKKRENKRLDWERYIDKVNNYQRKVKRTDRENAALVKAEEELAKAAEVRFQNLVHQAMGLTCYLGLQICRRISSRNPTSNHRCRIFNPTSPPRCPDHSTSQLLRGYGFCLTTTAYGGCHVNLG